MRNIPIILAGLALAAQVANAQYVEGSGNAVQAGTVTNPSSAKLPHDLAADLQRFGIEGTPEGLAIGLYNTTEHARRVSLAALGFIGTPRQLNMILSFVEAPEHGMWHAAISTAVKIGNRSGGLNEKTQAYLVSSCKRMLAGAKTGLAKLEAVVLLCQLGDISESSVVVDCLKDKNVASRAVLIARQFATSSASVPNGKGPDWAEIFGEVLVDKASSAVSRIDAVFGLEDIGTAKALNLLRSALYTEKAEGVRFQIQASLRKADRKAGSAPSPKS